MADASPEAARIRERVQTIVNRTPAYAGMCALVGDLLIVTLDEPQPAAPAPPPAADAGAPLGDAASLELDWPAAWALLERLAARLADRPGAIELAKTLAKARDEASGGPGLFAILLAADFESLSQAAQRLGVDPSLLGLLLRLALRPSLLAWAGAAARARDFATHDGGACPVCGSAPGLASLGGEGGQRSLHCSLCETVWPHPLLRCPACGNADPASLEYLKAESEEGLRVDLCRACGGWLKTIDLREISGPIILPLDDAATWHLDLLARKHLAH